jgi:two-component system chemotaxis response regulator CheY
MKKISVLIVDDSAVMRKIVERSLRQAGVDLEAVIEAGSGVDALSLVETNTFDLILSDINMPHMDGIEFLRQVRRVEQAKTIPVLMITTEGSEAKVMEAISLGAKGYIRKPFTAGQVRQQVAEALA